MDQGRPVAGAGPWLLGASDQDRLRAADRREIEEQAEMTRNTAAARMCEPLAVDQQDVRAILQRRDCRQANGRLAEGEEAGNVRKGHWLLDDALFDKVEVRETQHDDRRTPEYAPIRGLREAEIYAAH